MNCLLALVFIHSSVMFNPTDEQYRFDPARAFDQKVISSRTLQEELSQFRALRQFHVTRAQLETVQIQFVQMKKELDRAQKLRAAGTISENKYSELYYAYRKIEAEAVRLPTALAQDRLTAEFHRLRLLEAGNPELDNRKEMLESLIEGVRAELKNLDAALQVARCGHELAAKFLANGRELIKRGVISDYELEKRDLALRSAIIQVDGVQNQIKLAHDVFDSFSLSRGALGR